MVYSAATSIISFGHKHEFIQSEKEDQEIAEGCRRLIKNAIICWNYLFLTRALDQEPDPARKAEDRSRPLRIGGDLAAFQPAWGIRLLGNGKSQPVTTRTRSRDTIEAVEHACPVLLGNAGTIRRAALPTGRGRV